MNINKLWEIDIKNSVLEEQLRKDLKALRKSYSQQVVGTLIGEDHASLSTFISRKRVWSREKQLEVSWKLKGVGVFTFF